MDTIPVQTSTPLATPMGGQQDDPIASEVLRDYSDWREARKPFEGPWFVGGAMLRGQQHVMFDDTLMKLISPSAPTYRVRLSINRIRPKVKARLAKFFKARPRPVVRPASTERKKVLDARMTEKILTYLWNRVHLEEKHKEARGWATIASKGLWWFSWNEQALGQVSVPDPTTGKPTVQTAMVGEPVVDVGSPFELLVADQTKSRIGQQPKIIRARLMTKDDILARYGDKLGDEELAGGDKLSSYADKLATLRPTSTALASGAAPVHPHKNDVLVIEHFTAPCGKYPKGRYVVVVGSTTVKQVEELPYGMWEHTHNPFPCVEFMDSLTPGQFWGPTQVEQLIDIQREYNFLRGLVSENIRMVSRPKIIVYKQHNLKDGAWTNQAGEIVELNWMPGLPEPRIIQAANVAGDLWNLINLVKGEFDDLTQIYAATEGKVGDTTSGYQTNLLQEASDGVHAPDIREDELAIQEAAWKLRRLVKLGWKVPQLISIAGGNASPEVIEFSADHIDEYAEVIIQAGSMMPELKAARSQMAQDMFQKGMFGNPQDPLVRRRALEIIDMGGLDVITEDERRDIDQAQNENVTTTQGGGVEPAMAWEDHVAHIWEHANDLKSPETMALPGPLKQVKVAHLITHYDFVNPNLAWGLRQQFQLSGLPIASPPTPPPPPPVPGTMPGPGGPVAPPAGPGAPHPGGPPPPPAGPPHPPSPSPAGPAPAAGPAGPR